MAQQPRQRYALRAALADLLAQEQSSLSPEDVADVLWISRLAALAPLPADAPSQETDARVPTVDFADATTPPRGTSAPSPDQTTNRQSTGSTSPPMDPANEQSGEARVRLHGLPGASLQAADGSRGHVVQVTRPPALTGVLSLSRALRPLREWVDSNGPPRLDEEATAQASGEAGYLLPVWTPAREPRYSVDLLVDTGATMAVWHDLAGELYTALEVHGAFATVRCWALNTDRPTPQLTPFLRRHRTGTPESTLSTPWHRPLADRTGRRIMLVLTDGVGPAWYGAELPDMLAAASRTRPTAALQVLPRRLWHRTALHTAAVEARSADPERPGTTFRSEAALPGIPRGPRGAEERAAVRWLPVMEVDGTWLGPWAELTAGRTAGWAPMLAAPVQGVRRPTLPHRTTEAVPSAAERVARFRSGCSPNAYRLASHLAAAPLSLPVMRLVQQATVPDSGQTDLAEIFLSGLIERRGGPTQPSDPDEVVYDFRSGVREELLAELTRRESLRVLRQVLAKVSGRVAKTFGGTLDFRALAAVVGEGENATKGRSLPAQSLPFAEVAVAVLKGAGGQHRSLAQRLEAAIDARPQTVTRPLPREQAHSRGIRTDRLTPVRQVLSPPEAPYMVGRQNELATIKEAINASLSSHGTTEPSTPGEPAFVVIEGTPGMGRNRLVQEYVRLHGDRHSFIHWINARRRESLREGLLGLWHALAPAGSRVEELPLDRLWKTLAEHRDWLLVLDGVSNWPRDHRTAKANRGETLPYGFPPAGTGCVLATTNKLRWGHPCATVVTLEPLTRQETLTFLQTALGEGFDPTNSRQRDDLERMADMMPRIPDQLMWPDIAAKLASISRLPGETVSDRAVPGGHREEGLKDHAQTSSSHVTPLAPPVTETASLDAVPARGFRVPDHVVAMASLSRPDGRCLLATLSPDRRVSFWDPETGRTTGDSFELPTDSVLALAAIPDGIGRTLLATINYSGMVHLWDSTDGNAIGNPFRASFVDVLTITALQTPDRRTVLAIVDYAGRVSFWNPTRGTRLDTRFKCGSYPGRAITAIPTSPGVWPLLATADYTGAVRLRGIEHNRPPEDRIIVRPAEVLAMAGFSDIHENKVLATVGYDRIVRLWDLPPSPAAPKPSRPHHSWNSGAFMAGLLPDEQDAFLGLGVTRTFDQGEVILRQGGSNRHLMLIQNGWTKMSVASDRGQQLFLGLRGAGDFLGDVEFFDSGSIISTVFAIGRVQVRVYSRADFQDLLDRHPDMLSKLARMFTRRIKYANRRLTNIATMSVAARLATVLLDLAEQYGINTESGVRLPVALTQRELAGAVGATTASTERVLAEFQALGIVEMSYRQLKIPRLDLLRDRAGISNRDGY
ncbi:SAV_2336 N-terminal domain-related protein [Streptomyces lavendulae]|uniref:SAV_2336 N-terminal domain-related protein n=1 Tax=Streptomyces lavendulae TaxID=1914 RepID=UPI00369A9306